MVTETVRICKYELNGKGQIVRDWFEYEEREVNLNERWQWGASKYLRLFHNIENPAEDMINGFDSLIERFPGVDLYWFIEPLTEEMKPKERESTLRFLLNSYFPKVETISHLRTSQIKEFQIKTDKLNGNDTKAAFERFMAGEALEAIVKSYEKEEFDVSLLDFLEGKITDEKMINWGVGQVMKAHPKKFDPATVKAAITKRFIG
jgi:hypothetical protein